MADSRYKKLRDGKRALLSIRECGEAVAESYQKQRNCKYPSQTLLTKILLGVFGCVPAYDRFFIRGLKEYGLTQKYGEKSLHELHKFYEQHSAAFEESKARIARYGGDYTTMKLVDMFFWETGRIAENKTREQALSDGDE